MRVSGASCGGKGVRQSLGLPQNLLLAKFWGQARPPSVGEGKRLQLALLCACCPSPIAPRCPTSYHVSPPPWSYLYGPATFLPGPLPVPARDTRLWPRQPARNGCPLWVLCPHPHPGLFPSFIQYSIRLLAVEGAGLSCARP